MQPQSFSAMMPTSPLGPERARCAAPVALPRKGVDPHENQFASWTGAQMWAQMVPQWEAVTAGHVGPRGCVEGGKHSSLDNFCPYRPWWAPTTACNLLCGVLPLPGSYCPSTRNNPSGKPWSQAIQSNLPQVPAGLACSYPKTQGWCTKPLPSPAFSYRIRHSELHFALLIEHFSIICLHQLYVNGKGLNVFVNEKVTLVY